MGELAHRRTHHGLGAKPFAFILAPKTFRVGLWRSATSPGMYKALRKSAWPVREIIVRPLTELPDSRCRGHIPMKAANALALAKPSSYAGSGAVQHRRDRHSVN